MPDVFISYSRDDIDRIREIKANLESLGIEAFLDVDGGVDAGDAFPQRLADGIVGSTAVLACWTPYALSRDWCRRECFLARQLNRLVPVALKPVGPTDLREFIDASYEDLTDFSGQPQHFGWSQTLAALARKFEAWLEANPGHERAELVSRKAESLRRASAETRPAGASHKVENKFGAGAVWESVQDSQDPSELLRFADSFPSSAEGLEARRKAANLQGRLDEAFAQTDLNNVPSIDSLLETWPEHPRRAEAIRAREELFALVPRAKALQAKFDQTLAQLRHYSSAEVMKFTTQNREEYKRGIALRPRLTEDSFAQQDELSALTKRIAKAGLWELYEPSSPPQNTRPDDPYQAPVSPLRASERGGRTLFWFVSLLLMAAVGIGVAYLVKQDRSPQEVEVEAPSSFAETRESPSVSNAPEVQMGTESDGETESALGPPLVAEAEPAAGIRVIDNPEWTERPRARDYQRAYPERALDAGQSGHVILDCVVSDSGTPDCSVSSEEPTDWGFGEAALTLSREFQMETKLPDGTSVAGARVRIPIRFQAD